MESKKEEEKYKKYKLSLLYIQTKELRKLYENQMEIIPKYYYLVNKKWLDDYKKENNYKIIVEECQNFDNWKDYDDFKKKRLKLLNIKEEEVKREFKEQDVEKAKIINTEIKIFEQKFKYNINGELIKDNFFLENIINSRDFTQYEVLIGNKTILINDEENENYVYSYSLNEDLENEDNFFIEIKSVLMFQNSKSMEEEIKEIISSNGLKNYLIKKILMN